jgi:hypothetical protein
VPGGGEGSIGQYVEQIKVHLPNAQRQSMLFVALFGDSGSEVFEC